MSRLEFHPLANVFPLMTDEEVNDLGDDMLKHGQREPIWKYEDKILDGRNRYNACLLKDIEPRFADFRGADPLGFVVSLNLKRRHMTDSQRAMAVAEIAKLPKGAHPPNGGSAVTQDSAAKLLNVSVRSGQRARIVKEHGTPDLVDAVKHGDVKVAAAAEFAKDNPPLDQARLIAEHGSPAAAVKATVKAKADRAVAADGDEPAQAEDTYPIHFGSCHGGRVVTERTSTKVKAKADRAAVKQPKPKPMPVFRVAMGRADRAAQRRAVSEGIMRALDLFEYDGIDPPDRAAGIIERFDLTIAEATGPGKFSATRVRRAIEAMTIVFAAITAEQHEEEQSK